MRIAVFPAVRKTQCHLIRGHSLLQKKGESCVPIVMRCCAPCCAFHDSRLSCSNLAQDTASRCVSEGMAAHQRLNQARESCQVRVVTCISAGTEEVDRPPGHASIACNAKGSMWWLFVTMFPTASRQADAAHQHTPTPCHDVGHQEFCISLSTQSRVIMYKFVKPLRKVCWSRTHR